MSTFKAAIQSGLEEYLQALQRAIEGLTPAEMRWQPTLHTNHIAWLVWHMARVEDGWVNRLRRRPAVWQADGWADRFHMDPTSSGAGQTMEEVRAMPELPLTDLMAYFDAVRVVTRYYLDGAGHRHRPVPGIPAPTPWTTDRSLDHRAYPRRGESTRGAGGVTPRHDAWGGRIKRGAGGVRAW
jgi:hypothetical protein